MLKETYGRIRRRLRGPTNERLRAQAPVASIATPETMDDGEGNTAIERQYLNHIVKLRGSRITIAVYSAEEVHPEYFFRRALDDEYHTEDVPFEGPFEQKITLLGTELMAVFDAYAPKLTFHVSMRLDLLVFAYGEGNNASFDAMEAMYEEAVALREKLEVEVPWGGVILALSQDSPAQGIIKDYHGAEFARSRGLGFLRANTQSGCGCSTGAIESLVRCLIRQRVTNEPKYEELGCNVGSPGHRVGIKADIGGSDAAANAEDNIDEISVMRKWLEAQKHPLWITIAILGSPHTGQSSLMRVLNGERTTLCPDMTLLEKCAMVPWGFSASRR